MKTFTLDRFTSERQTTKMECQNREMNGLDGKHLIRKPIIDQLKIGMMIKVWKDVIVMKCPMI